MSIAGKQIVITRAIHQAPQLATAISAHGGIPILYPCIAIVPTQDITTIRQALDRISQGEFDWILFTSTNAITIFHAFVQRYADSFIFHAPIKIGIIGKQSAQQFHQLFHYPVALVTAEEDANSLATALQQQGATALCWFTSTLAPPRFQFFSQRLSRINIYDTVIPSADISLVTIIHQIDLIIFTSPSCVNNFVTLVCHLALFLHIPIACMGDSTRVAAQQYGFNIVVVSVHHSIDLFFTQINHYFAKESLQ